MSFAFSSAGERSESFLVKGMTDVERSKLQGYMTSQTGASEATAYTRTWMQAFASAPKGTSTYDLAGELLTWANGQTSGKIPLSQAGNKEWKAELNAFYAKLTPDDQTRTRRRRSRTTPPDLTRMQLDRWPSPPRRTGEGATMVKPRQDAGCRGFTIAALSGGPAGVIGAEVEDGFMHRSSASMADTPRPRSRATCGPLLVVDNGRFAVGGPQVKGREFHAVRYIGRRGPAR